LLGINEYLGRLGGDRHTRQMLELLASRLEHRFEGGSDDWHWCEDEITYDNAKLPHALLLSGHALGQKSMIEVALRALRWLTELHTSESGYFCPIGCRGFYKRNGDRAKFDQQPVEAHAMVSVCLEAYRLTSDTYWYDQARRAFDWFLGWNDLGLELYSVNTGGCYDGLQVDRVNQNQGAESTLAYLLSLSEMKLMQNAVTTFIQPLPAWSPPSAGGQSQEPMLSVVDKR
jgi:hypothetical protein